MAEPRIDEPAHQAGITTRNVRARPDLWSAPAARPKGRGGYDDAQARLRLITAGR